MSTEFKEQNNTRNIYITPEKETLLKEKKVNLNELMQRLNTEKKKEKNTNIILSAAAISTLAIFGIILTL